VQATGSFVSTYLSLDFVHRYNLSCCMLSAYYTWYTQTSHMQRC
jgi:hypothetical protein